MAISLEAFAPVISPGAAHELAAHLVFVDVRWYLDGRSGLDAYRSGHIANARFLDLDRALATKGNPEQGRHPLPAPEDFANALGAIGIGDDDVVVAYDDTGGGTAGRLVWMLRSIGQSAAILDGGMAVWPEPLVRDVPIIDPVARSIRPWPHSILRDLADLDGLDERAVVVDARASERYRGDVEPVDPRAGHIPVAKSLPWTELLADDGTLRDAAAIAARFSELGIEDANQLVASCGSGVTACMLLVAAEYAGLGTGRLFVPSFSGWSESVTRQVAIGS